MWLLSQRLEAVKSAALLERISQESLDVTAPSSFIPPGHRHPLISTIDEIVDNPEEFKKLPGADKGVTPWWPWNEPPQDLKKLKAMNGAMFGLQNLVMDRRAPIYN